MWLFKNDFKKNSKKVGSGTQSDLKPRKTFRKSHKTDKISDYKIAVHNSNDMENEHTETQILSKRECLLHKVLSYYSELYETGLIYEPSPLH